MTIGDETKVIRVDSQGNYELEVRWRTACPSVKTNAQWKQSNRDLNPKWITLAYENHVLRIRNRWKKYARLFPDDDDEVTRNLNLRFN